MKDKKLRRVNWFVRILLTVFILYLLVLITLGFLVGVPKYTLTPEYITLFILISVLILSESFDNLSMGKYLSLSREVNKKEGEIKEAKKENADLRDHILKMTTILNQNQHQQLTNNTIHGFTPEVLHMLGVTKADEDIDNENINGDNIDTMDKNNGDSAEIKKNHQSSSSKNDLYLSRDLRRNGRNRLIDQYLEKNNISDQDVMREVQFAPAFKGLDPIMERNIKFDAYFRNGQKEYFIEVLFSINRIMLDLLYVQLSKINYYSQAKNVRAQMVLIIPEFPKEYEKRYSLTPERVIEAFQPAILNDLVRIEIITISSDDIENWKEGK